MVSKELCFALLVCIFVQFVSAAAKPWSIRTNPIGRLKNFGNAVSETYYENKESLGTQYFAAKNVLVDVFNSTVQGVKSLWKIATSPVGFAKKVDSKIGEDGLQKAIKNSALETLDEYQASIKNPIDSLLKARTSLYTAVIEEPYHAYRLATSPIRFIRKAAAAVVNEE